MGACSFSSDAAGHLLSLDIDPYLQLRTTLALRAGAMLAQEHLQLLVNPFIPAQGIHYTVNTDKCKDELHAHMAVHRAGHRPCACVVC